MIKRTYECDLCHDSYFTEPHPLSIDKSVSNLIGLYWVSKSQIVERNSLEVEHHICKECIEQLAEIWKDHTG